MHVDVVDTATLLDAQWHPEKYSNLSVRISGWSARFATMNKDWQNMVIGRMQQVVQCARIFCAGEAGRTIDCVGNLRSKQLRGWQLLERLPAIAKFRNLVLQIPGW